MNMHLTLPLLTFLNEVVKNLMWAGQISLPKEFSFSISQALIRMMLDCGRPSQSCRISTHSETKKTLPAHTTSCSLEIVSCIASPSKQFLKLQGCKEDKNSISHFFYLKLKKYAYLLSQLCNKFFVAWPLNVFQFFLKLLECITHFKKSSLGDMG